MRKILDWSAKHPLKYLTTEHKSNTKTLTFSAIIILVISLYESKGVSCHSVSYRNDGKTTIKFNEMEKSLWHLFNGFRLLWSMHVILNSRNLFYIRTSKGHSKQKLKWHSWKLTVIMDPTSHKKSNPINVIYNSHPLVQITVIMWKWTVRKLTSWLKYKKGANEFLT